MAYLNFLPPIIAHRGASAFAPENTLAAFTKAFDMGFKWIEFDVMLTSDSVPIIIHDETLDRTTNAKGDVGDHDYSYLANLDAGSWFNPMFAGERIPSLQQVIQFLLNTKMCANVEIKPLPGQDEITAIRAVHEITAHFPQPNPSILFSSFNLEALQYLRKESTNCLMGFLMHEWRSDWRKVCDDLQCVSVHVNEEIMTQSMAAKIKSTGRSLLCYTVNDSARANQLYSWGVDAVFSDAPDVILKGLK